MIGTDMDVDGSLSLMMISYTDNASKIVTAVARVQLIVRLVNVALSLRFSWRFGVAVASFIARTK